MIESWIIYSVITAAVATLFYPSRKTSGMGSYGPKTRRYCDPMKTAHKRK